MSGKPAGQLAYEAWFDAAHGFMPAVGTTAAEVWARGTGDWHATWEAAAAAVETEQVRLAREDRDQLRKRVLDLAADLESSAAVTAPSKKSGIESDTAAKLRQAAEPPS